MGAIWRRCPARQRCVCVCLWARGAEEEERRGEGRQQGWVDMKRDREGLCVAVCVRARAQCSHARGIKKEARGRIKKGAAAQRRRKDENGPAGPKPPSRGGDGEKMDLHHRAAQHRKQKSARQAPAAAGRAAESIAAALTHRKAERHAHSPWVWAPFREAKKERQKGGWHSRRCCFCCRAARCCLF